MMCSLVFLVLSGFPLGNCRCSSSLKLKKLKPAQQFQLNIFDGLSDDLRAIQRILTETDINTLTPVEALMKLNELKNVVKSYR